MKRGTDLVKESLPSTQEHVRVRMVRESVIVLKNGAMTAVVEVEGVDLTRLSDGAMIDLEVQYENLLGTFRFPYQIIVGRKRQRLEEYLAYADSEAEQRAREGNPAYADALHGWVNFMLEVVRHVNPQAPLYLIVLPYDPLSLDEAPQRRVLTAEKYQRGQDELKHRVDQVIRGLARIGLTGRRLDDRELVAVLHRVYHPSIPDYRIPPSVRCKSLIARLETNEGANG